MGKKAVWAGRILSGAVGLFVFTSGLNILFVKSPDLVEQFAKFGYPESVIPIIGWSALVSSLLYMVPQTSVLGAILLTGYLGGAVATHTRIEDPQGFFALVLGMLAWLALYLRNDRLRTLIPLTSPSK